jgi:alanine racemase
LTDRWAEVDLSAIGHNLRHVALLTPGTRVIAVIKANAYGHGAIPVAHTALGSGAWGLAVSTLTEARQLLEAGEGEHDRVLALGGLVPGEAGEAAQVGCAVMCHSHELARALDAAARARGRALPVHLKVDTGMSRLGCAPDDAVGLARFIAESDGLRLAGTFTHFASSDSDEAATRRQAELFESVIVALRAGGIDPGLRHVSNSGGALRYPDLALDAVRLGISLYGYDPGGRAGPGLEPALAVRALVTQVKTVGPGTAVGYGATWWAERPSRIATVSIGYADGVMRSRSNRGDVLVRGRRAPLVGAVSMDALTLDVTEVDAVATGDVATVIGRDGHERITADDVAEWSGTNSYEVLTAIGGRVERRYGQE